VGKRYATLVVLRDDDANVTSNRKVLVRCDCGVEKRMSLGSLTKGTTRSCGCLRSINATTHGQVSTPTYRSWRSMVGRCRNEGYAHYDRYGGRGIKVCDRWDKFENFYADMGDRPKGYTLDRIDPAGNYEPTNCRWLDKSGQRRNQRKPSLVGFSRFKGVHKHQGKWAAMISINNRSVRLGQFAREVLAAKAYDRAAIIHHGENAVTNAMLGRL